MDHYWRKFIGNFALGPITQSYPKEAMPPILIYLLEECCRGIAFPLLLIWRQMGEFRLMIANHDILSLHPILR